MAELYAEAIAREADEFDNRLADIRRRQDAGELTVRQAADERVSLMEAHLARLHALRTEHFGEEDDGRR